VHEFVNADTIARGLSEFNPEGAAIEAGRVLLRRLHHLTDQRLDVAFETTLASRSFAPWIRELKTSGYDFHLFFIVAGSGTCHQSRAESCAARRFDAGLRNFFELYGPLATVPSAKPSSNTAVPASPWFSGKTAKSSTSPPTRSPCPKSKTNGGQSSTFFRATLLSCTSSTHSSMRSSCAASATATGSFSPIQACAVSSPTGSRTSATSIPGFRSLYPAASSSSITSPASC